MLVLSLFDGISCGQVALQRAGIKVDHYFASEVDKYAIQITQKNFPNTHQLGDVTKIDWTPFIGKVDLLIGGSPCFPAGTLITTKKGLIPIEEIKVGDEVWTHKNRWQKVIRTGFKFSNDIRSLSGGGCSNLICTGNHPFYVRNMIRKGTIRTFSEPYWLSSEKIQKQMVSSTFPIFDIKPKFNKETWYFFGRYIGDGWYRKTKRRYRKNSFLYSVTICDSLDKYDELKTLFDSLGYNYNITYDKKTVRFTITRKELVDYIENEIGHLAHNKHFPKDLWGQPDEFKKAFINGYFDSDGCYTQDRYKISTVSKRLAYDLKTLIMMLYNILPQVHYNKRPETTFIEERLVHQKPSWEVIWLIDTRKQQKWYLEDNIFWSYLRHNDSINKDSIRVYNLEVNEDNSYLADTMIVHNCQDLSIAKQDRKGLEGSRSGLFFKFLEALKTIKPKWFLFENVASMSEENKKLISSYLEAEPVMINSALVSAQNRKRLYWTNIPDVTQPEDKGIVVNDILEDGFISVNNSKSNCLTSTAQRTSLRDFFEKSRFALATKPVRIGTLPNLGKGQANRIYSVQGKSVCLNANGGGSGAKTGLYKVDLPDGDYIIRKLTPTECERLQTLPDDYTIGVSDAQRYKCLGNGWTVDVIVHILKGLKNVEENKTN